MDINRFQKISKKGSIKPFEQVRISQHIPMPEDTDYQRGYIERYFIQKSNDTQSAIMEVDMFSFQKFASNPFYNVVQIDWKISGDIDDVKQSNQKSIALVSDIIPNLKIYLPNLKQFTKK